MLITVCSEDVEVLWPESEFAGLFDAEIFSSRIGVSKPDPQIYLACCEALTGRKEDAIAHLRVAFEKRPSLRELATRDTDFDSLRDEPAFSELVG